MRVTVFDMGRSIDWSRGLHEVNRRCRMQGRMDAEIHRMLTRPGYVRRLIFESESDAERFILRVKETCERLSVPGVSLVQCGKRVDVNPSCKGGD